VLSSEEDFEKHIPHIELSLCLDFSIFFPNRPRVASTSRVFM